MDKLLDTSEHTLQTYKEGLVYCLVNKCEHKAVFLQGEDLDDFWEEFNRLCQPNTTYTELLRRLWDIYSEVVQPCQM